MPKHLSLAALSPLFLLVLCACPDGALTEDGGIVVDDAGVTDPYAYAPDYEAEVQLLPLAPAAASPNFEYSGLDWFGDVLIVLPEFADGAWAIQKSALVARIDGTDESPIAPTPVSIIPTLGPDNIPNFDGFEAITFVGNTVYLSIETS